ncbi:MAG: hypothetical protein NT069_13135, partial [Planctomycetota bacterium]|nr:hypothetical protein [Planctomycetota bacterium]
KTDNASATEPRPKSERNESMLTSHRETNAATTSGIVAEERAGSQFGDFCFRRDHPAKLAASPEERIDCRRNHPFLSSSSSSSCLILFSNDQIRSCESLEDCRGKRRFDRMKRMKGMMRMEQWPDIVQRVDSRNYWDDEAAMGMR